MEAITGMRRKFGQTKKGKEERRKRGSSERRVETMPETTTIIFTHYNLHKVSNPAPDFKNLIAETAQK